MKRTLLKTLLLACLLSVWGANAHAATLEDVITHDVIGVSGTTYTDVTFYGPTSRVTYEGTTAGGNSAIQLRTSGGKEGFVSTVSCGKVTKIAIKWNSNTTNGRKLDVYGSNTAYSASTDLYDSSKQGTLLVEFAYADGDGEFTVTGDYEYIGIRSNDSALYLDEIDITWDGAAIDNPDGDDDGGDDGYHDGDVSTSSSTLTLTNPDVSVGTETTSIDFTSMGFTNEEDMDGRTLSFTDGSTVTFAKGQGQTTPKYYTTGTAIRVYADNTMTFTCEKVIAKIELHDSSSSYNGNTTTETVEFSEDGKSAIYCNLYTSTSGGTQLRVQSITIYYEGEGGDDEPDPEPTGHGYEPDDPYTCSEAIEVISALASGGTIEGIYVKGIVSQIGNYSSSYGDLIYYISDDGNKSNQLEIYYGYYLNNEKFTDNYAEELMVGDEVIVYGTFTNYNGKTPEGSQGSTYIYSLTRNGETPEPGPGEEHTFNFADNTYGMTVYSGSDGDYETEVTQITSDGVVLNFDSGHYRLWNSSAEGNHLRIGGAESSNYDAYCTISGPTGSKVLEVVITSTGSSDNMSESNPTVDPEGGSYASHVYTWTGEAESVTFHFTSVTHVYYIDVTTDAETGTFSISSAGYATYYIEDAYIMPEGVTGTTVTGVEDTAMTDGGYLLETAWGYTAGTTVPAKTALVLKGEAGTYTYTITSTDASAPTDNLLLGSTTETETTGPNGETTGYVFYELTNGSSGIGFYYGADYGAVFTSAANKAWLPLDETQARNAKFLGFGEGDTTGITSVENEAKTVKGVYTLQGVKVSNMSQPGLYIVDGKKVIKR